ncbi:MAG: hypothetical protein ACRCYU_08010 [Nocardioides sp.]
MLQLIRHPICLIAGLVVLTGCGHDVVIDALPTTSPYAGSLASPAPIADAPDVLNRAGPAGRALECRGKPVNGGSPDRTTAGSTPNEAVENWLTGADGTDFGLPQHGYRIERTDPDRVLLSFDVNQASKTTVVVGKRGRDGGRTSWAVESWAMCDPAELPAEITEEMHTAIWTDSKGRRVFTYLVSSRSGAEHCGWEDITFLTLGQPPGERRFVRDTTGEFSLSGTYDAGASLPEDAIDTEWEHAGRHLWLAEDNRTAYLVNTEDPTDVEAWPRATEPLLCM